MCLFPLDMSPSIQFCISLPPSPGCLTATANVTWPKLSSLSSLPSPLQVHPILCCFATPQPYSIVFSPATWDSSLTPPSSFAHTVKPCPKPLASSSKTFLRFVFFFQCLQLKFLLLPILIAAISSFSWANTHGTHYQFVQNTAIKVIFLGHHSDLISH